MTSDVDIDGFSGTTLADAIAQRVSKNYGSVLPSLNLRYEITDPLILRFSAYKTLSRPKFGDIRIGSRVDFDTITDNPTIARGNPDLAPYSAKNLDLSLEWYPNSATSAAVQGFYKSVKNFTINQALPGVITLPDGTILPVTINTTVNDPGTLHFGGVEVLLRRDLDFLPGFLSNLGVKLDYSHNWTDARDSFASIQGTPIDVTPNNFTADLFNGQLYYSVPKFDFRLAYRYYSQYSRGADNAYQTQPDGQFDVTANYRIARGFRIIGSVRNLTKSIIYERFIDYRDPSNTNLLRNSVYNGRSFTLGLRLNL